MRIPTFVLLIAIAGAAHAQAVPPPGFAQCGMCHAITAGGPKKLGPELSSIVDKAAATKPGFTYSKALKGSRIVWSNAKLDAFLAQPSKAVPGTTMVFAGLRDPAARAAVIAYLKTLK